MELQDTRKLVISLDERNARHVSAAEKWLSEGNVPEACKELRSIERVVAGHPAVIQLRRRLVAVLCGWDEEPADTAVQAA